MNSDGLGLVDLKRMRAAVEVARAATITTAAQTLGLTQSAVSRTIGELEQALGQRLFERLPRGIRLTDAGQVFVERARRVLAEVDDLVAEIARSPNRVSGRLRLGVTAIGSLAAPALAAFAARYPEVGMETEHASEQALCPKLIRGDLDFLIGSANYLQRWRELEVVSLAPLHFACMLRRNHPLAAVTAPTEQDVFGYPMILPESVEVAFADIAQRYAEVAPPSAKPRYLTSDPALIGMLVQGTDAFFPVMSLASDFGGIGRDFLLLQDVISMPRHRLGYARVGQRPCGEAAAAFERVLAERLQRDLD